MKKQSMSWNKGYRRTVIVNFPRLCSCYSNKTCLSLLQGHSERFACFYLSSTMPKTVHSYGVYSDDVVQLSAHRFAGRLRWAPAWLCTYGLCIILFFCFSWFGVVSTLVFPNTHLYGLFLTARDSVTSGSIIALHNFQCYSLKIIF